MKILLTGAHGQVGWELTRMADRYPFKMVACDRATLDITDARAVERAMGAHAPDVVINAAAYTQVDQAEQDTVTAWAVNRDGAANLAKVCQKQGCVLMHLSTDYVFDGHQTRAYTEHDPLAPLGVYGQSKAAGEERVAAELQQHIILRTAWVYSVHGHNFVKTMLRLGQTHETIRVVNDQFGSPTCAADIAEALLIMVKALEARQNVPWGIYHYTGKGRTSWHGFALAIFETARQYQSLAVKSVEPIPSREYSAPAPRPAHSMMSCAKIEKAFKIVTKEWKPQVTSVVKSLLGASSTR